MPRAQSEYAAQLRQIESELTGELTLSQDEVLRRVSVARGENATLQSFHGQIGGKNRRWVDVARAQFFSPEHFFSEWIRGLAKAVREEAEADLKKYGRAYDRPSSILRDLLLSDPAILEYVQRFHERSFYRHIEDRVREKPDEGLWRLWFGANQTIWGLLIAPTFRNDEWVNDVSEVRRAPYTYWTVGHVLSDGLIDPGSDTPVTFNSVGDFQTFYRSVIKRLSSSGYEHEFSDRWLDYLGSSKNPSDVPLLLPELRYLGLEAKHQYRLDFAVLNSHVMELTGFEISPSSSHMSVKGMKAKTQKAVNEELRDRWNAEVQKRRDYFDGFGIRVETFADGDLTDLEACFGRVQHRLDERPMKLPTVESALGELRGI